jgi:hypothetical protein
MGRPTGAVYREDETFELYPKKADWEERCSDACQVTPRAIEPCRRVRAHAPCASGEPLARGIGASRILQRGLTSGSGQGWMLANVG